MACCRGRYYEEVAEDGTLRKVPADKDSLCFGEESRRNLIGFFILGLINNFAYVVFLSAATDILPKDWPTSIIVLVEMIPCLVAQALAPLLADFIPYWARVIFLTTTAFSSFFIVAFVDNVYIKLAGVALASYSSGMGEPTWMSLSSYYHKNVVSLYSSGTGGAGIGGSVSYLVLQSVIGLSPALTMVIVAPLTLLLSVSYFFILEKPRRYVISRGWCAGSEKVLLDPYPSPSPSPAPATEETPLHGSVDDINSPIAGEKATLTLLQKARLQVMLLRYTAPLFLVYFAEYLINAGVNPAIRFPKEPFFHPNEYKYYSFLYQAGVFVSRSSVNFFRIKLLWLIAAGQCACLGFFFCAAWFSFIPSIWVMFPIIFFEGLLGGAIYVNTFYLASEELDDSVKEFCLGSISVYNSVGILLAGFIGVPVQQAIECHLGTAPCPWGPSPPPAPTPNATASPSFVPTLMPTPSTMPSN